MLSYRLSYYLRVAAIAFVFLVLFRKILKGHDDAPVRNETIGEYDFLQVFEDDDELLKYSNVYFIESSGPFRPVVTIEPRYACAIEAAARANPRKNIIVLLATWMDFTEADHLQIPDLRTLLSFRNVHFRWLDLERFALGTQVDAVIKSKLLYDRPDGVAFLSEILRMVLLFKFGGIYLDLDVVTLKPLEFYHPNFFGARTQDSADTSVMGLQRGDIGRSFAYDYLTFTKDLLEINPNCTGTTLLTNKLLAFCEKVTVQEIVDRGCFGQLEVFSPNLFHPFDETNVSEMFDASKLHLVKDKIADSMAVHMHHHHSRGLKIDPNGETGYEMIAKTYCPSVYQDHGGDL
uniref:Alpha 1,4-glycosyltransferase domain-containing protein n=1 Tax=Anopheles atroparvus TaxID=41427 RepID=A0A182IQ12_ANOAO